MKQCTKCKKEKPLTEFCKRRKNSLHSWCKACTNIYKQQYRQTHKIECAKYDKKYQETLIGYLRHRFYKIKGRCNNPNNSRYANYGGHGLNVCLNLLLNL